MYCFVTRRKAEVKRVRRKGRAEERKKREVEKLRR